MSVPEGWVSKLLLDGQEPQVTRAELELLAGLIDEAAIDRSFRQTALLAAAAYATNHSARLSRKGPTPPATPKEVAAVVISVADEFLCWLQAE